MDGRDITGAVTYSPGSIKARVVEPVSASRNEASTGRDAGSVASRGSVSFPQGIRVTYVTERRSSSGTRAASKRYGNEMPTLPDSNPCPVWMVAQLGREKGPSG